MGVKVLVVEDEISINDILSSALKVQGYDVRSAFSSAEAKTFLSSFQPNLAMLDINLPDEDGFELCKFINANYSIPIIMLTARNDVVDKILGLELGADDYITKPFHIKEVLTRVKVAVRRVEKYSSSHEENILQLNKSIKINTESRVVLKEEEEIRLKPKEYDLLEFLAKNRNRVFSREELLDKVWDMDYDGELRTVDVHIRRLRSKLDNDETNSIIETVFGVGYVMR
ncbi:response regulator transcription factor [Clostridium sp. 19966]|uniref:response regulator transcription factor n=1 Tax=Clostridium sp. 19966 TaxID=2768166 RepID=UPI0028DECF03|nr:response regulator transcription factor [Clostridium sp. 19966]MDT8717131.1 response regulator transcription factor [Clostridium sp. 19966]